MLDPMTVGRVQLPDGPIYVPQDSDTAMQAPEWASFLFIVDGSLNPVPLCDLDQVPLKEVMAESCGLTLSDLKRRSPEHLSATVTGCESLDGYLEPAAVKEDADDRLSEIASTIPPVDPSCPMRPTGDGIFFERTSVFERRFESSNEDLNSKIVFALIAIQLNPIESKLLGRIAAKAQQQQRAHQIDRRLTQIFARKTQFSARKTQICARNEGIWFFQLICGFFKGCHCLTNGATWNYAQKRGRHDECL